MEFQDFLIDEKTDMKFLMTQIYDFFKFCA